MKKCYTTSLLASVVEIDLMDMTLISLLPWGLFLGLKLNDEIRLLYMSLYNDMLVVGEISDRRNNH
ncbi:hypothetical protein MKX62_04415 [Sporosarcina sp. FSL K6-5500]